MLRNRKLAAACDATADVRTVYAAAPLAPSSKLPPASDPHRASGIDVRFRQGPAIAAVLMRRKPAVGDRSPPRGGSIRRRITQRARRLPPWRSPWLSSVAAAPFPLVILGAAIVGFIGGRVAPAAFALSGHASSLSSERSVIDDDTPTPAHARFSRRRLAWIVAVFLAIWAVALAVLAFAFGWDGDFTQMGWFFTKAALLT